ncbi:MAG: zf-HC2 domain-containing protein [Candidatus Aminicenantes bacterium]|nr:zf-HC2 domain-containing protein [Candidatus Aminicenantes bacterium]MDH5466345.1 zf-HC2 domain-containing protein [Candidatus Aminicenantes bacterium]MDH5704798.1 zf-HC2 domain-containing protein [Candidatus Aminicenantes bacterium]
MRNCIFEAMIDDYLLKRLSEDEMKKFEEHYFNCSSCFEKLVERDELVSIIKSKGDEIFKDEYISVAAKGETWREKVTSFLTPRQWAAAAVSAAFILVIIFSVIPMLKPTAPQFFINDDAVRGGSITLISPVFEAQTIPSHFEWKALGKDVEYKIYIFDNGNKLWEATTKETSVNLPENIKKGMTTGEKYSWQVKAFSPEGTLISMSSKVQFKINDRE